VGPRSGNGGSRGLTADRFENASQNSFLIPTSQKVGNPASFGSCVSDRCSVHDSPPAPLRAGTPSLRYVGKKKSFTANRMAERPLEIGLDPTVVSPAAISENSPDGRPSGRRRHNCARALLTFRPVEAAQTLKGRGCRGEARDARSLKLTNSINLVARIQ
jgi:hypothetical protein